MCLILCAWKSHPKYELLIAANRDEFLARPSAPASWWEDSPDVLGGRDLEQMGTWLGCTRDGRFAAVTNVRERSVQRKDAPSRGWLTRRFLESDLSVDQYLDELEEIGAEYNGYNLLVGADGTIGYHSNRGFGAKLLTPGIYGISNHLLDTPWPKVRKGKDRLSRLLARSGAELPVETLFELLSDRTVAPDDELPDTGLGIELERMVSPIFTVGKEYGTRCSTVLIRDTRRRVYFEERDVLAGSTQCFEFLEEAHSSAPAGPHASSYRRNHGTSGDRS